MNPTGDLLITDNAHYRWTGGPIIRTTYVMLLFGLNDVEYSLPLLPGSQVRIGPYRCRVLAEEPEQASVLLMREGGTARLYQIGSWLRWLVLRAILLLGRWASGDEEQVDLEQIRERMRELNTSKGND
jgi:hypothetical protein